MGRKTFRKVITSDEMLSKINRKNIRLMESFLKHKNAKCSDQTIIGYRSDLNIFFCYNYMYNDDKFFINIKKLELAEFFDYGLLELKWSGNRYARMRSLISSFSDFICDYLDDDYPDFRNLINKAVPKVPKIPVRKKTVITEEQVYGLRNKLLEEGKLREATYLMLLASSGARISESLRINVDMIDENCTAFGDLFLETTEELKTKGHGKNGEMMTRFLIKDTFLPIYKKWLKVRDEVMKQNNKHHNKMFIKSNGDPIESTDTVRYWISKWEDYLGVPCYAHMMRHFIVSDLTRKGCSSSFIVAVMKWKSGDAMYNIYNDVEDKDRHWKEVDKLKNAFSFSDNENLKINLEDN